MVELKKYIGIVYVSQILIPVIDLIHLYESLRKCMVIFIMESFFQFHHF